MGKDEGSPADKLESASGHGADRLDESPLEARPSPGAALPLLPSGRLRGMFKALGFLEQLVASLLLVAILGLVLVLVVRRYIGGGWPGTGEIARYSLVWATMLIAGFLMAYPPFHISINLIDYLVKGRWLGALKLFVNMFVLLTSLALIYGCYQLVVTDIGQVTPAAGIPVRFINMVPLVGFSLVALRAVLGIVVRDLPTVLGRGEGPS